MRKHWRLAVVLGVQIAILAAVPARQVWARISGTLVTLRTAPVDPFDVLAGHYVTLAYEVERPTADQVEPGLRTGDDVWISVARGEPAWTLVSVTKVRPAPASGHVSIHARWHSDWWGRGRATLQDVQRFYVSADRGADVAAAQRGNRPALVDLRVDEDGTPAIVALRAGGVVIRE